MNAPPKKKKKKRDGQETKASTRKPLHKGHFTMVFFFFFLKENFNLWCSLLMIALYHLTKTQISF